MDSKTMAFIEKAKSVHGDKYDYSETLLENNRTKVKINCLKHGFFFQFPANHLKGSGCKICAQEKRKIEKKKIVFINSGKKLTQEEVINRFKEVHGDKYDYSEVNYVAYNKLINIICPEHGIFEMLPNTHWRGSGCPNCNHTSVGKKLTQEEVINRFKEVHGDKYDYSEVNYVSNTVKVKVICPEHGVFEILPYNHWQGGGCNECKKNTLTQTNILEKLNKVKHELDNFDNINYIKMQIPIDIICEKHGPYEKHVFNYLNGFRCPKCSPKSKAEIEIQEIIPNSILNSRKIIEPLEIDIFSEEYKFGIEYNGIMFHTYGLSDLPMFNNLDLLDKNKHLTKTNLMEEKGYQLFHINELDWLNSIKKEIWKSILNSKMGLTHRIFARKLKIIDLSTNNKFVNNFMEANHLQGYRSHTYAYGLCNSKNEVYCIMTFGKPTNSKAQWEIYRFATALNYTIVGGASKILKYFERIHKPDSLLSYAKRDWSQGIVYEKLGFKFSHNTEPSIKWYEPKTGILYSRLKFQKHKLKEIKDFNYNKSLTADENMYINGYRKYFDSGNKVYYKYYNHEEE